MTKLGRKGFMLAEVVVVSAVISAVLVTMYIAITRVSSAYQTRNNYYDIDALFLAEEINDLIKDNLPDNPGTVITEDLKAAYTNKDEGLGYTEVNGYYIKDISDLDTINNSKQTFKDYKEYLKTKLDNSNYDHIIISELCKDDDCYYYALKVGEKNAQTKQ